MVANVVARDVAPNWADFGKSKIFSNREENDSDLVYIESTNDYTRFVYDVRNRPIDRRHVEELFYAIEENNLLEDFPIVCEMRDDGTLVVLDGQHRLEAAKLHEVPIYYKVSRRMKFSDVTSVNNSTMGWTNLAYLHRWVRDSRLQYLRFKKFIDDNPHVRFDYAITLCMQGNANVVRDSFRNGTYEFNNKELAEKVAAYAKDFEKYAPSFYRSKHFQVALRTLALNPRYDHSIMMRKLEYLSTRLRKCADSYSYVEMLLDIYNFKARGKPLTMDDIPISGRRKTV